jgi:omega-6 fatty acid desaturase (delta-12 desaturase)
VPEWQQAVAQFAHPDTRRSTWQIINSLVPYAALWVLMVWSLEISYWLTLGLSVIAAAFLVRGFIILHDCGHGSFFKSRTANDFWGVLTGVLTFTPYYQWRHEHSIHHASAGNLDRRGMGDVWTLTVDEYRALPPLRRLGYRLYRHPLIMFGLGPFFIFILTHRVPRKGATPKERFSVLFTNVALLAIMLVMHLLIGIKAYLLIQGPVILLAGLFGTWLFYVQHQFEGVYWEREPKWDYMTAALHGSSYYRLPKLLQWFSGNIGLHHIHHLSPRIPNYNLQPCLDATPLFQITPITLLSSLKSLTFRLWDEQARRLVGFAGVKAARQGG